MIGRILSEASHSIIGMLSAKPADMETRTANQEFSSLLLPGENRGRPASGNAAATLKSGALKDGAVKDSGAKDGVKDHGSKTDVEQFLSQLIGIDDQPVSLASDSSAKTIGLTLAAQNVEGEAALSAPAAPAHNTQFTSALQPLAGENASAGDETQTRAGTMFDLSKRNPSQPGAIVDEGQDQPAKAKTQTAPALDTVKQASTLPVNPNQIANEARKASTAAKPKPDAETTETIRSASTANGDHKAAKDSGSARQMQDMLGLRMNGKSKAKPTTAQQIMEAKARNSINAASKPAKADAKPFLAEMSNIPAAGDQERSIELSAPQPATPLATAQNAPQNMVAKTVSFDWNAPQFAERFASELSDLNINGDLKKFEINPRNMGRLEVSFISRGGVETIRIEAESDAAREVIVQHSQAIQDLLKANGRSDLNLRVDVRENMFAASDNGGLNPQQNSSNEREGDSAPARNRTAAQSDAIRADSEPGQQGPSDNSRYA